MERIKAEPFAVLWSGGKDSCLALWRARQSGLCVKGLVNFYDKASERVRFHATRTSLIEAQARAIGVELFQYGTTPDTYAKVVESALNHLKLQGYSGAIAGDIHLRDVREWNEEMVGKAGLRLVEPLWHENGDVMLNEFVAAGFRGVITCSDDRWSEILRPGREISKELVAELTTRAECDISGENGEYHSFVFDGPLFTRPINWVPGEVRRSNGFSQLDLILQETECEVAPVA